MTIKHSMLQRLPMLITASVLSTGLLISGCSNNDNVETDGANTASDTAAIADNPEIDAANQTAGVDTKSTVAGEQMTDSAEDETAIDSDNINPVISADKENAKQPSLVTNPTQSGTPEDTVKQALDSLYQGDVKKSAGYYKVDMANFEAELAKTQSAFQQTVDGVTILDTTYNADKTRATITGELMLKGQSEPAPLTYELQKIAGQWKILG
ncbi:MULTISPECIES: hypothetical protein [unclassified Psychrobacter]|jgi:hypothetical protein|uniref:hypothetical protein n=1 Tax=unclassified Psychrobacter TaxID=196806 RepID=UPI0003FD2C1D|nr:MULTISPECIES: hypothetical protein [unclassified Psychrobacter]